MIIAPNPASLDGVPDAAPLGPASLLDVPAGLESASTGDASGATGAWLAVAAGVVGGWPLATGSTVGAAVTVPLGSAVASGAVVMATGCVAVGVAVGPGVGTAAAMVTALQPELRAL